MDSKRKLWIIVFSLLGIATGVQNAQFIPSLINYAGSFDLYTLIIPLATVIVAIALPCCSLLLLGSDKPLRYVRIGLILVGLSLVYPILGYGGYLVEAGITPDTMLLFATMFGLPLLAVLAGLLAIKQARKLAADKTPICSFAHRYLYLLVTIYILSSITWIIVTRQQ